HLWIVGALATKTAGISSSTSPHEVSGGALLDTYFERLNALRSLLFWFICAVLWNPVALILPKSTLCPRPLPFH
ncbi:MAG: hypothetical protein ACI957_001281, partial [Verrucomicrobiales bacterium]